MLSCRLTLDPIDTILCDSKVLAVISYGEACASTDNPRHFRSGLHCLDRPDLKEVWSVDEPAEYGITEGCYWTKSGKLLFACLWVEQSDSASISQGIERAYTQLLGFTERQGYPYLARFWNYISDINQGSGDDECYKQFCEGRYRALQASGYDPEQFPAASALGHHQGDAVVYVIAAREPCQHFENPQQISAYNYPRQYGSKSPSFARASLQDKLIYLSGTASIVGHETQQAESLSGQLKVTFDNLDKLIQSVREKSDLSGLPAIQMLKVYIRHPEDLAEVMSQVQNHYGADIEAFYLHADICRSELLVEIEGICVI